MQNFWERITTVYCLPSTFNFILKEDIDIYSTIVAEVTYLIRNRYVILEKDRLKIINKNLRNLSKTEQYLMRIIACELDFKENIFKALVLEDGKNKKIILTSSANLTLKFLICFIPFACIFLLFNFLNLISKLDIITKYKTAFDILKLISCFLTMFMYKDTYDRFKNVCSKNFILTIYSKKDKNNLKKYLNEKKFVTPNIYLNIFLNKDNSKHEYVKYII